MRGARCISTLRKTLGDGADQWIETVPKLGYRFTPEVSAISSHAPLGPSWNVRPTLRIRVTATQGPVRWSSLSNALPIAILVMLVCLVGTISWRRRPAPGAE
jgi:hypothetical protein